MRRRNPVALVIRSIATAGDPHRSLRDRLKPCKITRSRIALLSCSR